MIRRVGFVVLLAAALAGCTNSADNGFQGWVEADLIFVSPDETGRVETLSVREGDAVTKGSPLFTVDPDLQQADLAVAQATLFNARQAFDRAQTLVKSQAIPQRSVDEAEAALRTAQARLDAAQTRLTRRKAFSPVDGTVQQIYYRPGEMVPAGRPVIALLPPGNIKVRFFVPETELARISLGENVLIKCDGCAAEIPARVSFISRTSEFTPPVIYSQEERSKLVFMIEARTDKPDTLRVGQPVTVVRQASAPGGKP
jgi:HlyD family secretion protein